MQEKQFKQGDIWMVNLNPTRGSEQAGYRPVLILSGNLANDFAPVLVCCPLTTKLKNYKGNLVLEPNPQNGLTEKSEVMAIHIRSISKERFIEKIGSVSKTQVNQMKQTINELLNY
ncbi:MAG: type II toxin-antitoxin system PemK/MazF family toxin [Bacteroidia bacterium]|nr:type II toxin-antitoxin system PemK/MazF family toxin [Bacteroidia bacterium]